MTAAGVKRLRQPGILPDHSRISEVAPHTLERLDLPFESTQATQVFHALENERFPKDNLKVSDNEGMRLATLAKWTHDLPTTTEDLCSRHAMKLQPARPTSSRPR
jgi:hypothetical protein